MRRTILRSIAAASALLALAAMLEAARRPHYGGELRIEIRAAIKNLDPAEDNEDPAALGALRQFNLFVFETLVRLDDHGQVQPWLATSWTHDPVRKAWVFTARKNVKFQDGSVWSPTEASLLFPDDRPIEQILRELVGARNSIAMRTADGTLVGTGPFRVARWEAGKSATLAAFDQYWGGRPYLDSVSIQMGRNLTEQASDFQIGKADVIEIPVRDLHGPKQRGTVIVSTPPIETLALQFESGRVPDPVRKALALSIDRTAIHNVLLQKEGEITGALLPRWLSGYSFLFPVERNIAKAKQLSPAPTSLVFGYDRQDTVMRPIAERIAVNASEAGIALRSAGTPVDVKLVRLPVTAADPWLALADLATLLKSPQPAPLADPYEFERKLLEDTGVIPLFHLPQGWMLQSRVMNWPDLEDVWLDAGATP